ncbi:MAG: hypothetical protein JST75_16840 [Bacteroidetes bacterium]|nr:hypothetical protein [Bacteroidota bacterium]
MVLTGKILFPYIFGQSFNEVYFLFILLIPGLFAACSSSFFTAYYFGTAKLKYNFVSALIYFISMLILFLALIKILGVKGPAVAFSIASVFSLLYDAFVFKKIHQYNISEILFAKKSDILFFLKIFKREKPILGQLEN